MKKFKVSTLKISKQRKYNSTNTCDMCREFGKYTKLYIKNAYHELDDNGDDTGRWLCKSCYSKIRERRPDSRSNLLKSVRSCRTGNKDPNSNQAKGDLFQKLTCIWRSTISIIPVEDLNKINDNYNAPIDHTIDSELGIIQTKGRLYNSTYERWHVGGLERDWNKKFDNMILYCTDNYGKYIERIYIFPILEIVTRTDITIYRNASHSWVEKYRIKDKEIIKKVNEIYSNL